MRSFHSHGKSIFIRTICRTVYRMSPRSGYGFENGIGSAFEAASAVEVVPAQLANTAGVIGSSLLIES